MIDKIKGFCCFQLTRENKWRPICELIKECGINVKKLHTARKICHSQLTKHPYIKMTMIASFRGNRWSIEDIIPVSWYAQQVKIQSTTLYHGQLVDKLKEIHFLKYTEDIAEELFDAIASSPKDVKHPLYYSFRYKEGFPERSESWELLNHNKRGYPSASAFILRPNPFISRHLIPDIELIVANMDNHLFAVKMRLPTGLVSFPLDIFENNQQELNKAIGFHSHYGQSFNILGDDGQQFLKSLIN